MPFYQYECKSGECRHTLEEMQGIKADPLRICPKCGRETLARVITAPGLVFKGEGWTPKHYT